MSAQKNQRFLIIVGAAVLVLVAVFTFVRPLGRNDNASGAIGAVKKHHETQITPSDVILGDEALRKRQAVLYGDYLKDAAALKKISADLGLAYLGQGDTNDVALAARTASQELAVRSAELKSRYYSVFGDALVAVREIVKQRESAEAAAILRDVEALEARLNQRGELDSAKMNAFSADLAALDARLRAFTASRDIRQVESDLSTAIDALQGQAKVNDKALMNASAQFELAQRELASRGILGARLEDRQAYLAAIAGEEVQLESSVGKLASMLQAKLNNRAEASNRVSDVSAQLADAALSLESRALNNLDVQLASNIELASALRHFSELASFQLNSRNVQAESRTLANFNDAVAALNAQLRQKTPEFQSRAGGEVQAELAAIGGYLASAEKLNSRLANAQMANKELANAQMANKELANAQMANKQLANAQMANRELANAQMANKELANAQMANKELANAQMANREMANKQMASRELANREMANKQMASRELANREMASRQIASSHEFALANVQQLAARLANQAAMASFSGRLADIEMSVGSSAKLGSQLKNSAELASQAKQLESKASMLGSVSR